MHSMHITLHAYWKACKRILNEGSQYRPRRQNDSLQSRVQKIKAVQVCILMADQSETFPWQDHRQGVIQGVRRGKLRIYYERIRTNLCVKPFFYSEDCPKNILVPYLPEIMGKLESVLKAKVKDWTDFQKKQQRDGIYQREHNAWEK